LLVGLVDELWSGVTVAGAPSVEGELALSHRAYVAVTFALPLVGAAVLEAGVALLSDVWGRGRLVAIAQWALSASLVGAACASSPLELAAALAFAGASSGAACGAAQALLVTSSNEGTDRIMVRWSLYGVVGDVLTPVLTAAAVALGYSFRGAMLAIAVVVGMQGAVSTGLGRAETHAGVDAEPDEGLIEALARAARMPRLWTWLAAAASCTLLDEIVIALGSLRLAHDRGASMAAATATAVTFSAGAIVGTALSDRATARWPSTRILVGSALACAAALLALFACDTLTASCVALFFVGLTCAPHHPLAMARAYDELHDRPGTVQAIGQLFVVVDVLAPLVLGIVADRFGLRVALACLAVQPAVILACAALLGPPSRR
jgi:MFS family permease